MIKIQHKYAMQYQSQTIPAPTVLSPLDQQLLCNKNSYSVFYDLFNITAAHQEMQYIYLFSYLFSHLADAFIQSDLQMRIYTNIYHMIKK